MSTWHAMTKKPTRRGFYAVEDGWEGSPLYAMFVPETGLWGTPQLTLGKLANSRLQASRLPSPVRMKGGVNSASPKPNWSLR